MSFYTAPVSVITQFVSHFDTGGRPKDGSTYQYSLRIDTLNKKILNQEFSSIIHDKELFWQAFCVAYVRGKGKQNENYGSVGISGQANVCKEIQDCVEVIRGIFLLHWKKGTDFFVIPIYKAGYYHFISEMPNRWVNLTGKVSPYVYSHYNTFVKPTLHVLCHMLNCVSHDRTFCLRVKLWKQMPSMLDKYHAIEVRWLLNPH